MIRDKTVNLKQNGYRKADKPTYQTRGKKIICKLFANLNNEKKINI